MNIKRIGSVAAIAAVGALALSSCAANESSSTTSGSSSSASASSSSGTADLSSLSGTLNGIGSSAQATAQTTWTSGFQGQASGVTINYNPAGSGAGVTGFTAGSDDFAGSDIPLTTDQLKATFKSCAAGSSAIDIPDYISPIAIAYNVQGLSNLTLDASTIAKIFSGKITMWNDPAIAKLNSGASLPAAKINVVHRSDKSGTTANFTEYLAAAAPSDWTSAPSEAFPVQIGDAAQGTSGVAAALKSASDSITYIDNSGATGLSKAKLSIGGKVRAITAAGAAAVVGQAQQDSGRSANDLALTIPRTTTGANDWPIVLASNLVACQQYADPAKAKLIKAYFNYIISDAGQKASAAQAGSAPLSSELAAKDAKAIASIK
ncbi:phosphate ABC transporter substrate-binding protein PstS [Curtobacterium ammoniigenes]|uniref:phosphate ABC transporter substrate-binding protein PstS n=1 Tax=Curtobacterium ammoniigenes TaxID=395387 RepID=UPI0008377CAA|nr:phosphate ABC transporter substrate-binding protein PstS [Curtobacterium ammoniigenes]